jgi:hypothetical protein
LWADRAFSLVGDGRPAGARRPRVDSGGGQQMRDDQPLEVVNVVRHADFHFGPGDAEGSYEERQATPSLTTLPGQEGVSRSPFI